jgi:hypothetical protein
MPSGFIGTKRVLLGSPSTYSDKMLGTQPANLIGYWPMDEPTGAVAIDYSSEGNDGAYTGVTLGQTGIGDGKTCPLFDGSNDVNNLYSAGLIADFSGSAGTIATWAKVSGSGVWTDSTARYMCAFFVNSNNYAYIYKASANNRLVGELKAGGSQEWLTSDGHSETDWWHFAFTWDKTANQTKLYHDGSLDDSDDVTGTWSGSITKMVIGALNGTPTGVWDGYLAHTALWTKALTLQEINNLATV